MMEVYMKFSKVHYETSTIL